MPVTGNNGINVVYRLDFRPPSYILKRGLVGAKKTWMNSVFGPNTVFTAKTLRGVSRFALESLFNEHVDGSKRVGALKSSRHLYPNQECFVYKIDITGLEYVDVINDIQEFTTTTPMTSKLYAYCIEKLKESLTDPTQDDMDDLYFNSLIKLIRYKNTIATHTEEVIVKGPIDRKRITLYQTLPKGK